MKPLVLICACLVTLFIGHGSASASETIYRCGASNVVYSHTPCSTGRPVDADDARTEAQQTEARLVARRMQALADSMEHERQVLERQAARSVAIGLSRSAPVAQTPQRAVSTKIKLGRRAVEKAGDRPELTAAQ